MNANVLAGFSSLVRIAPYIHVVPMFHIVVRRSNLGFSRTITLLSSFSELRRSRSHEREGEKHKDRSSVAEISRRVAGARPVRRVPRNTWDLVHSPKDLDFQHSSAMNTRESCSKAKLKHIFCIFTPDYRADTDFCSGTRTVLYLPYPLSTVFVLAFCRCSAEYQTTQQISTHKTYVSLDPRNPRT